MNRGSPSWPGQRYPARAAPCTSSSVRLQSETCGFLTSTATLDKLTECPGASLPHLDHESERCLLAGKIWGRSPHLTHFFPLPAGRGEVGILPACPVLQSIMEQGDRSWGWEEEGPPTGRGLPPVPAQRPLLLPIFRQVKPVVSGFLHEKQLPYNEDSYLARFRLFLSRYEEFMVQTPPITELVGLQ